MATKKAPPKKPAPKKPATPAKKATAPKKPATPAKKATAPEKKAPPKKPAAKKPEPQEEEQGQTLLDELLQVTGQEPAAEDEEDSAFKMRLASEISEMSEKAYDKLSERVKAWYSAACEAVEKETDLPNFDDFNEAPETAAEEETTPASKKGKDKPAKKVKAPKEGKDLTSSPSGQVRVIVCENPDITLDELKEELKERGVEISDSQAHAVHNMTVRTLKVLRKLGKLK